MKNNIIVGLFNKAADFVHRYTNIIMSWHNSLKGFKYDGISCRLIVKKY